MPEKSTKKKPEIPQPKPDIIHPDHGVIDFGSYSDVRSFFPQEQRSREVR